uniref:Uncharacterized protein n=1 Tax=Cacopsylla melanoneura TaxID=428564 RepID=A0A8D8QEW4_9HEMI
MAVSFACKRSCSVQVCPPEECKQVNVPGLPVCHIHTGCPCQLVTCPIFPGLFCTWPLQLASGSKSSTLDKEGCFQGRVLLEALDDGGESLSTWIGECFLVDLGGELILRENFSLI